MTVAPPRWAWLVVSAQSALLVLLGAVGFAVAGGGEVQVLFLRPNAVHSILLLVTGVLGLVAAQRLRPLVWFCTAQFAVFLLLFYTGAG